MAFESLALIFAGAEYDRRIRAAGCDGYIAKPISVRALPEQLAAFLPGGGDG